MNHAQLFRNRSVLIKVLWFLCTFSLLLPGCMGAGRASQKAGRKAYSRQNWESAVSWFREAVTQDRQNPEYYTDLGMALYQIRDYEAAKEQFSLAVELDPKLAVAYRGLGMCLNLQGKGEEAVDMLTRAAECAGEKNKALYCDILARRAEIETECQRPEAAEADYLELVSLDYERGRVCLALGSLCIDRGDAENGMMYYQASILDNYQDYRYYVVMLDHLSRAGFQEDYDRVLEAALGIPIEEPEDRYGKGLLYLKDGQTALAFQEFEQAYAEGCMEAGGYLGYCYEQMGDYPEAETVYRRQLLDEPENAEIYNSLTRCHILEGLYGEALDLVSQGLLYADKEWQLELLWNRMLCYEKQGNMTEAAAVLREYLSLAPSDMSAKKEAAYLNTR